MRVIASVQSKRGSSRGLIHYISHSKIDTTREPESGRELFNAFADELSVKSANNSIKSGVARDRPSNEGLHHLVLSFRPDDYHALGSTERQRKAALKAATRAAMERLETALNADRVSWAAAIHLNTKNPHVHIAIQKEFLGRDLKTRIMTKIPRETLPHFELRDGDKVLVPGILIDATTEKVEQLIAHNSERTWVRETVQTRDGSESLSRDNTDKETNSGTRQETNEERDILRLGILAEHELLRIVSRLEKLTDHGDRMRFQVTDPVSRQRRRLSLQDLERLRVGSDPDLNAAAERQIRTILLKMRAKERSVKDNVQKAAADTTRQANEIKKFYKKRGWKLPTPSLTKDEIDRLQNECIERSNLRKFSFLESIRTELECKRDIEPRSKEDFARLAAQNTISEMRSRLLEKNYADLSNRQYVSTVDVGKRRVSLAQLDREEAASANTILVLAKRLKDAALRLAGNGQELPVETENDQLRRDIKRKFKEQLSDIRNDKKSEETKAKVLGRILTVDGAKAAPEVIYSPEQLAEMEAISLRLKLGKVYEESWKLQREMIEAATSDSPASRKLLKANPVADFTAHKNRIIAGRAFAREIVARVEIEKAKEHLKAFTRSKRFQKFAIADKKTGDVAFLSLNDVDLRPRGSILDRTIEEVFESREHRALRRTVTALVKGREQTLKDEVAAAKEILSSSIRDTAEFKQFSLFGFRSQPILMPILTSFEIVAIEKRVSGMKTSTDATRLQQVLESATDRSVGRLSDILRDFENPQIGSEKERDPSPRKTADLTAAFTSRDVEKGPHETERSKEPGSYGHLR